MNENYARVTFFLHVKKNFFILFSIHMTNFFHTFRDIWIQITYDHLGIGEFQVLTQTCKFFCNLLVSKRAKFLRILKDSIEIKLLQWAGIDKLALSTLNDDFILAGSALLAIMNREF